MPPPPPNTHVLAIEERSCTCEPLNGRKWDKNMAQPAQAAGWSAQRWSDFSSQMNALVRSFKKDGIASFLLLGIPLGVIVMLIMLFAAPEACRQNCRPRAQRGIVNGTAICQAAKAELDCPGAVIHVPIIILSIFLYIVLLNILKGANQAVDRKIAQLCAQFSDAQVTLAYHAIHTGVCKPKGTTQHRYLYVTQGGPPATMPAMATGGMTVMQVTCPPNCKAGDQVQIMGPSGPMMVVVPAGVSQGMTFQVQAPAVVVATAVPVTVP